MANISLSIYIYNRYMCVCIYISKTNEIENLFGSQ